MGALLHLSIRLLLGRKLTLVLLILAVAVGVGFQLPNSANLNGYGAELVRRGLDQGVGHLSIHAPEGPLTDATATITRIRALPFVRKASGIINHGGAIRSKSNWQPTRLIGATGTFVCDQLATGQCFTRAPGEPPPVILGGQLAQKLKVKAGDDLRVVVPYSEADQDAKIQVAAEVYRVTGILKSAAGLAGDGDAFLKRDQLASILDLDDAITEIVVHLKDYRTADQHLAAIQETTPHAIVQTWRTRSTFVANTLDSIRVIARISAAMVMGAVTIPVMALLFIDVLLQRREIGLLVAIGFARRDVLLVYLIKTALVGLIGSLLGLLIGYSACRYFQINPIFESNGFVIRPVVDGWAMVGSAALVFGVTVLSGLLPALLAARSNPSIVVRGGAE